VIRAATIPPVHDSAVASVTPHATHLSTNRLASSISAPLKKPDYHRSQRECLPPRHGGLGPRDGGPGQRDGGPCEPSACCMCAPSGAGVPAA